MVEIFNYCSAYTEPNTERDALILAVDFTLECVLGRGDENKEAKQAIYDCLRVLNQIDKKIIGV